MGRWSDRLGRHDRRHYVPFAVAQCDRISVPNGHVRDFAGEGMRHVEETVASTLGDSSVKGSA